MRYSQGTKLGGRQGDFGLACPTSAARYQQSASFASTALTTNLKLKFQSSQLDVHRRQNCQRRGEEQLEAQREARRLTTILAIDVVGYSRLMAVDESKTLAQLRTHRQELIEPKASGYHGRVVKLMGDGTLMEFSSVVDAVNFAVDLQTTMIERNSDLPDEDQVAYRIGINIGDIIVEGDDIYGDGVNIASRLEGLAEPGGICVSRSVYSQVKNKLDISFQDMGEQELKNIPDPLRTYRIAMCEDDMASATVDRPAEHSTALRTQCDKASLRLRALASSTFELQCHGCQASCGFCGDAW